jgi:hypothetical protein
VDRAEKVKDQLKTHTPIAIVDKFADIPRHAYCTAVAGSATTTNRVYLIRKGTRANNVKITLFHETIQPDPSSTFPNGKAIYRARKKAAVDVKFS